MEGFSRDPDEVIIGIPKTPPTLERCIKSTFGTGGALLAIYAGKEGEFIVVGWSDKGQLMSMRFIPKSAGVETYGYLTVTDNFVSLNLVPRL